MKDLYQTTKKNRQFTSTQVILLGFLFAIILGALLLKIPIMTAPGEHTSWSTAFFTATTSICVTGLVVVDTYSHWSFLGQLVILALIQIGGFGVITMYSLFMMALKRQFSLRTRTLIQDYYNLDSIHGLIRFLIKVVRYTLLVEAVGVLLYLFSFVPRFGLGRGLWISIFNSISAFCNAGMDVIGPSSLIPYQTDLWINLVTMTLIILGGLGYVVWFDVLNNGKEAKRHRHSLRYFCKHLSEHSKLVLLLTGFLIVFGAAMILLFEWNNPETIGNLPLGKKILASFFQSVTFRTAGFASMPQEKLSSSSCLIGCILMFIGGSPVGTAGGIKTTTIFVILLNAFAFIRNRNENVLFHKRVTYHLINKATAIVTFSLSLIFILTIALVAIEDVPVMSAFYEIISATATVGLSRGLTASLHNAGKILVMFGMYAGRISTISMALFFTSNQRSGKNDIKYAKGRYIVG